MRWEQRWPAERQARLRELIAQRLLQKRIAEAMGCAPDTIRRAAEHLGLELERHPCAHGDAQLLALKKRGLSLDKIAAQTGRTRGSIIGRWHRLLDAGAVTADVLEGSNRYAAERRAAGFMASLKRRASRREAAHVAPRYSTGENKPRAAATADERRKWDRKRHVQVLLSMDAVKAAERPKPSLPRIAWLEREEVPSGTV